MVAPHVHTERVEVAPPWYKSGIIYEVHVRSFLDTDGDGTGDFRGLTEKLDYIKDLGVTAIWLLPFYPSPLKDDGYDIADFRDVHPRYGTLSDFKNFLREAHDRDLKVITELVLNHTSDQHPWFQRARRAKPGSAARNFYVWSDTPDLYRKARIIFNDVETSNWTWDKTAGAYFWHRFFSHQPDLNYDNPDVREAMIEVMDYWFDMGVDGLRLDAVPYLFEREGTSCENLPETHAFLKELRRHVDEKYSDRMLLAEANQWPEDAVAYFGEGRGDECHMAFHFPLMPRLFMALRMEDRMPITDILQQTPAIPETAQWALFLRNHDELTLEMVTDEERDYMYRMYAHIRQARLNFGIRRRLAPLVGNDRRRIELLVALLFSLPGTPVLYYGDEIGMGENVYLGDRNGVRTPMQWSADKNAGFSRANPQSLYLPINLDPENHYEAVNVEVQERNPHSLLSWTRRLIALYKRWKPFGMGTLEFLQPENRKVLACIRRYEDEAILVVMNLSRFIQPVKLDLAKFAGRVPLELFGHAVLPAITAEPYFLTLGPHAFYWFSLETKAPARADVAETTPAGTEARPVLTLAGSWEGIFAERYRMVLSRVLQSWLPTRRWFAGKTRMIKGVNVEELIPLHASGGHGYLAFLHVEFAQSESETYLAPLACAVGEAAEKISQERPDLVVARLVLGTAKEQGVLYDGLADQVFCQSLLKTMASRRKVPGRAGQLEGSGNGVLRKLRDQVGLDLGVTLDKAEYSNSSVIFGDRLILKLFRRMESGLNPELEVDRFLSEREFAHAPALAGALEYQGRSDEPLTVGVLTAYAPGCKNGWDYMLDVLSRFYERVGALPADQRDAPPETPSSVCRLSALEPSPLVAELIGTSRESARVLGKITAEMHAALVADAPDSAFASEPSTPYTQRGMFQSVRNLTRKNLHLLAERLKLLPPETRARAERVLGLEGEVLRRFRVVYERSIDAVRIRSHGDYHLRQVLYTGKDFLVVDFEGEPSVPLSQRRLKRSPLRDVAGMVRSFHYAAHAGMVDATRHGVLPERQTDLHAAWERVWAGWMGAAFFKAYRAAALPAFLPANENELEIVMQAALLSRAIHELGHELEHRPEWVNLALSAILELLDDEGAEKSTRLQEPGAK